MNENYGELQCFFRLMATVLLSDFVTLICQAINNKEYMIAADDKIDMDQWLEIIHRCMEEDTSAPK